MRVTAQDVLAAHRLTRSGHRRTRRTINLVIAGIGIALLFVVPSDMRPWIALCVALVVVGELIQLGIDYLWIPARIKRLHAQHRALHESIDVSVVEDGVHVVTPHATSTLPWAHVRRWHDGPEHVVLMQTDALMVVLPKRDFADTDLAALRAKLSQRVGPAG
ncbi:YcxB family protein [Cognatilysobacter terrigena]|uniref:YcxB family protein n=1 Tax=Cognatilysobacter terrigena TaxID=2488749 RepID=UPI00105D1461|nr:YcxB family protein [Lysobacter terrigena]